MSYLKDIFIFTIGYYSGICIGLICSYKYNDINMIKNFNNYYYYYGIIGGTSVYLINNRLLK